MQQERRFRRAYFVSSALLSICLIFMFWVGENYTKLGDNFQTGSWYVIVFFIVMIFYGLVETRWLIKFLKGHSKTISKEDVKVVGNDINPGINKFQEQVIVSIISLVLVSELPIGGVLFLIMMYLLLYRVTMGSTEYYPNITLILLGWDGLEMQLDSGENMWVFFHSDIDNGYFDYLKRNGTARVEFLGDNSWPIGEPKVGKLIIQERRYQDDTGTD